MTTPKNEEQVDICPVEKLLKLLSGKWKSQIFRLAVDGPVRFNNLLRQMEGSNKQSISLALKDMESKGLLLKEVVSQKPLHIEYHLSEKGRLLIPIFKQLESVL